MMKKKMSLSFFATLLLAIHAIMLQNLLVQAANGLWQLLADPLGFFVRVLVG